MKTVSTILTITVAVTCSCFGQFNHDDEFNDGSVVKVYRPHQPRAVTYDKERLLNSSFNFTVKHGSLNMINTNNMKDITKEISPIVKSIPTHRENFLSSLPFTPLQPNVDNLFIVVKAMYENKTILEKKVSPLIKVVIKI